MIFSSDYLGNITTFEEFPNIKCRILKYADPDHVYTWHTMPKTFSVSLNYSNGVIMSSMASQIITSVSSVCLTVGSGTDKKHQSSTSLAFVRGIHRLPVNSLHKRPVTRKMFPFDDVMMQPERQAFACRSGWTRRLTATLGKRWKLPPVTIVHKTSHGWIPL